LLYKSEENWTKIYVGTPASERMVIQKKRYWNSLVSELIRKRIRNHILKKMFRLKPNPCGRLN
jgi:hypothetical protein